jgi:2-polyprenyl-6-methoxyphenol hydroxylase-like FAD-dependent oxidoreductase
MSSRVLVVGGGRVGTALAALLINSDHAVTILDERPSALSRLRQTFGNDIIREGGMTDPPALEAAGVRNVDVVAATTANDEYNLVITCLARFHLAYTAPSRGSSTRPEPGCTAPRWASMLPSIRLSSWRTSLLRRCHPVT